MFQLHFFNSQDYSLIRANKRIKIKTVEQANKAFPLYVIDMTENEYVGRYDDFASLRKDFSLRRDECPNCKIKIMDTKYHDFTDYFLPKLD